MALPRGAIGLSAACDCGIFLSYSLTIYCMLILLKLIFFSKKKKILSEIPSACQTDILYDYPGHLSQICTVPCP